ncbi:MAG: cystathionine beta-lyase [Alphaproteobacteria bacterium]|nr:cystathionine beta-lyase [Alphaproteobacteria bacterium]
MKRDTKLVTAGRGTKRDAKAGGHVVNTPVYHASTILFDTVAELRHAIANKDDVLYYGRRGTPTQESFKAALNEFDGGVGCLLYPSGVAAITSAILAFVRQGDHILVADSVYEPTRVFCNLGLKRLGVETTYYDPMIGSGIEALFQDNTRLVFTEAPGSLTFEMQDIPAIAEVAHAHDAVVLMDNTWATPLFCDALALGVDVSILSCTKYIVGHSDAMLGSASADEKAWPLLKRAAYMLGQTAAPDDVYLASRGLRTLGVRLKQHEESAIRIAKWLEGRDEVDRVRHPAFETCPGHEIWKRDFTGSSGLFSFTFKGGDDEARTAFLDAMDLFKMGFSWGGFESLSLPADPEKMRTATSWGGTGPLVRLQIGLEDPEDLIADLEKGFSAFRKAV